ncbi:MAG: T9SS type A sorting domain-containing protein, partial [Bacteroidales bacterium]
TPSTVNKVNVQLSKDYHSIGKKLYAVIIDKNSKIIDSSNVLTIQSSDIKNPDGQNPYSFIMKNTPILTNTEFYVGIVLEASSEGYTPLLTQFDTLEIRPDAYFMTNHIASKIIPRNDNTKVMIEAELGPPIPTICIVTNSLETEHTIIAWERINTSIIKHYSVYRETVTGGWEKIGTLPYDSISVFKDITSEPQKQSYKYRISSTDSNTIESPLSVDFHATLHLNVNKSELVSGANDLSWDHYRGNKVLYYKIYRGTDKYNLKPYDSIQYDILKTKYTDTKTEKGVKYFYRVAAVFANACYPTKLKAESGPFSQSVSNLSESSLTNNAENSLYDLIVFPNPAKDYCMVTIKGKNLTSYTIELCDTKGNILQTKTVKGTSLMEKINLKELSPNVYTLRVVFKNKKLIYTILKE